MGKNISVFCTDKYLRQKIYLILSQNNNVICADISAASVKEATTADIVIWNIDDKPLPNDLRPTAIALGNGGDLPIPFSEQMLSDAIEKKGEEAKSTLEIGEKCAYLYGKNLRFTDVEFALFSALAAAKGNFVSRDELIHTVWGEGTTEGILNVYIHYLREKLEFCGEKIIISSRKFGYKIDGKYLSSGGKE